VEDCIVKKVRIGKSANPWWTPERVERFRALWHQRDPELAPKEIADRMGCTIFAAVGKAARMPDMPPKLTYEQKQAAKQAARAARPKPARKSKAERPPPAPPPPVPPTLAQLGLPTGTPAPARPAPALARLHHGRVCQWPIGEPSRTGFRFCGAEAPEGRLPYCPDHRARAVRAPAAKDDAA
jgi:GcrA cell cycle regulator